MVYGIGNSGMQIFNWRRRQAIRRIPLLGLLAMGIIILGDGVQEGSQGSDSGKSDLKVRAGSRNIRPPAAAGSYYPEEVSQLFNMVESMMMSGKSAGCKGVEAVLVPHAGYVYSGEVAAASFREIDPDFRRVFILAANHNSRVNLRGVSVPTFTHYAIPSVNIPLSPIIDELQRHPLFTSDPRVHTDYMIEAELPFLHYLKGRPVEPDFAIVPMILGRMGSREIEQLVQILNRYVDPHTCFVFSVDLSHFHDDERARKLDMHTIQSIMSMDTEALGRAVTDGNQVLLTMVELAKRNKWEPTYLKYRNSGNVTGDRNRVVGYGSIAFHEPFKLNNEERLNLLSMARSAIDASLGGESPEAMGSLFVDEHPILRIPRGVFVTLKKQGRLRGCIGELFPRGPLYEAVKSCAVKAATQDHRFRPVTRKELDQLSISISVLEFPRRISIDNPKGFPKKLRPGEDGVILVYRGNQSTFLPKVWEEIPDPVSFLSRLCLKQGAPPDCWQQQDIAIYRYGTYDFSEEDPIFHELKQEKAIRILKDKGGMDALSGQVR